MTTWLHRIVVNACLDRLRRRRPTTPLPEYDSLDFADRRDDHGSTESALDVRAALAQLPEGQRLALVLVDMHGLGSRRPPRCSASPKGRSSRGVPVAGPLSPRCSGWTPAPAHAQGTVRPPPTSDLRRHSAQGHPSVLRRVSRGSTRSDRPGHTRSIRPDRTTRTVCITGHLPAEPDHRPGDRMDPQHPTHPDAHPDDAPGAETSPVVDPRGTDASANENRLDPSDDAANDAVQAAVRTLLMTAPDPGPMPDALSGASRTRWPTPRRAAPATTSCSTSSASVNPARSSRSTPRTTSSSSPAGRSTVTTRTIATTTASCRCPDAAGR